MVDKNSKKPENFKQISYNIIQNIISVDKE